MAADGKIDSVAASKDATRSGGDNPAAAGLSDAEALAGFDASFEQARRAFVGRCEELGIAMSEVRIGEGPDSLLLAHLGHRRCARKLVVLSGVHGIEGFPGSAAQLGFLRSCRGRPPGVHVILVHIVNPHGMRHFRRNNADNVDLNRNVVADYTTDADIDRSARKVSRIVGGRSLPWMPGIPWMLLSLLRLARLGGIRKMQSVFGGGQYFDPEGLFFGGAVRAAEVESLFAALEPWLAGADPANVILFDLHSGIGAKGECSLLANGGDERHCSEIFATPISQGHSGKDAVYAVRGDLLRGLKSTMGIADATAVTFECGTGPAMRTFLALRRANIAQNGFRPGRAAEAAARRAMITAFCPESNAWRRTYVQTAVGHLRRALAYLEAREARDV